MRHAQRIAGVLAEEHRDAVDLFARGAARHPDADEIVAALAAKELGNDLELEGLESFGIAEESGDADQQVLEQHPRFVGVIAKADGVARKIRQLVDSDAPLYASHD